MQELIDRQVHRGVEYLLNHYQLSGDSKRDFRQAAFVGVVEAAAKYDPSPGAQPYFWAFAKSFARGRILDEFRRADPLSRTERRKVKEGISPGVATVQVEDAYTVPCARPSPLEDAVGQELHSQVEKLPAREAAVIKALYFDDLSQAEAARIAGVSPGAIWQMKRSALKRLRSYYSCPPQPPSNTSSISTAKRSPLTARA